MVFASIIITNYNYSNYLARCIRSAILQNINNEEYEVIVIDDKSTDNSISVLESFRGSLRVIASKKNEGLAVSRNKGVDAAIGKYIVFLDADDYLNKHFLLFFREYIRYFDINAISSDYILVDDDENHKKVVSAIEKPIACGILFKKSIFKEIGGYDKDFICREEEDFKIRYEKIYGAIPNLPLPLYRYRMHNNNLTKNLTQMAEFENKLKSKHNLL